MPSGRLPVAVREGMTGHHDKGEVIAFTSLRPEIPVWVTAEGVAFLSTVVAEFERTGILTVVDGAMLGQLAEQYAEMVFWRAEQQVARGTIDHDYLFRVTRALRQVEAAFTRSAIEFGLTPVARARGRSPSGSNAPPPGDNGDLD